jgi:ATP-dependent Clp protease ATP-binding subunit ClpC
MSEGFDRFSDRARKVMGYAKREAQRLGHDYIGTEHILLGLLRETNGVASRVMENLKVNLDVARDKIEKLAKPVGKGVQTDNLRFTTETKRVLEHSITISKEMASTHIGTEHLLLGLLREEEGLAAQALINLGLNMNNVYPEVEKFSTSLGGKEKDKDKEADEPIVDGHTDVDSVPEESAWSTINAKNPANKKGMTPALNAFGKDLTEEARQGRLDPLVGREKDLQRLLQILVNAWRSRQKRKPETESPEQFLPRSSEGDPEERHSREETRAQLLDCLDGLSPREKEVILLRDIEERSIKEAAVILGSSPLSVRVHLSSARKKLKERIKEKFPHLLESRR